MKVCEFVEETVDPYSVEGLSHIQENCACRPLPIKVPEYSFYKEGKL